MMLMPFGKHKGKPVDVLPRGYLQWLQDNVELRGELAKVVRQAFIDDKRIKASRYRPKPPIIQDLDKMIEAVCNPAEMYLKEKAR